MSRGEASELLRPKKPKSAKAVFVRRCLRSIMLVFLIECFVFNWPFWESLTFSGRIDSPECQIGTGLTVEGEWIRVSDPDEAYVQIDCGGVHVDNVGLEISTPTASDASSWRQLSGEIIPIHLEVTDAGNAIPYELPQTEYCSGLADSHVIRVHLSGGSQQLRIYFDGQDAVFRVEDVSVNCIRQFNFSGPRALILLALVLAFQLFRPSSFLYKEVFDFSRSRLTKVSVCVVVCLSALVSVFATQIAGINGTADTEDLENQASGVYILDFNHYNHLAESIVEGSASLDLPVADTLKLLDNPYDSAARSAALQEAGEAAYLDYAYYDGSYYCYFGVLPALLLYVPYELITGHDLRTDYAAAFLSVCFVVSLSLVVARFYQRYFKGGSLGLFLVALISILFGSGVLYLAYLPQTYSIPILSGLSLALLGIFFWLGASDGTGVSKVKLFAGGACIALTMACRPQYVLLALLAFPIFWNEITRQRLFFSRKGLTNTALVMTPFVFVAIPLMVYNNARFGSPIDFGAEYNLTGADMVSRGFSVSRFWGCLFEYFVQPLNINASYPFIHGIDMSVDYQGFWFFEPYLGGFFAFSPVCCALLLIYHFRNELRASGLLGMVAMLCAISLVIVSFDLQAASITTRYFSDFAWMLLVSSWLVIFSMLISFRDGMLCRSSVILSSIVVFAALGVTLQFWCLLSDGRYAAMSSSCPAIYYSVKTWISFLF